jgi:hypothetical protein
MWGAYSKVGSKYTDCEVLDWFQLDQDGDQWRVFCEHSNEHSSSIKGGEFHDQLNVYQLLKDSAPRT